MVYTPYGAPDNIIILPRRSAFSIALPSIVKRLREEGRAVLDNQDLVSIFEIERYNWKLPLGWYANKFIDALLAQDGLLYPVDVVFKGTTRRYGLQRQPSPEEVAASLHRGVYLCYYSALAYHGLTDQRPRMIYVNVEQQSKPGERFLTQEAIDGAFSRPQRVTTDIGTIDGGYQVTRVRSVNTYRVGIMRSVNGWAVTNLERTLVDACVRPTYSGGVHEVAEAYRRSVDSLSINKLVAILGKLNFLYPYHQVVGWYLTSVGGMKMEAVDRLYRIPREYDFYVAHGMTDTKYDPVWRVHYPAEFSTSEEQNVSIKKSKYSSKPA